MHHAHPGRRSLAFRDLSSVSRRDLLAHSFDLVHFPMYLARRHPARVRLEVKGEDDRCADLRGHFVDLQDVRSVQPLRLVADVRGIATDSDDFYQAVHETLLAVAGRHRYLGFDRAGPPVFAPLFALAALYRTYGRGDYRAGHCLPTPCVDLKDPVSYDFEIR